MLLNLLKRKEKHSQTAAAILYPDKIIIVTRNTLKKSSWYITDNFTILTNSSSDNEIAETVINHLDQSISDEKSHEEINKLWKSYLIKTKLKSNIKSHENARFLSVFKTKKSITIHPKENKNSERLKASYHGIPDKILHVDLKISSQDLGKAIRLCWDKCTFS